MITKSVYK